MEDEEPPFNFLTGSYMAKHVSEVQYTSVMGTLAIRPDGTMSLPAAGAQQKKTFKVSGLWY